MTSDQDSPTGPGGPTRFVTFFTTLPGIITAAAALVTAIGGAFYGGTQAATPSPTVTVTQTEWRSPSPAPPTAPVPPVPSVSDTATVSPVSPGPTGAAGTLRGSYSFQLPALYYAPLGPQKPTQPDIVGATNSSGDISWKADQGGQQIEAGTSERMLALPNGSTPTYQACSTGTQFITGAPSTPGSVFCILERPGLIAGVQVTSVNENSPTYVTLQVSVWQGP
ncbi:hypothetical protein ACFXPX_27910 [Kitasatospora sp. NPDC059146]|uniref:hypothetical protein n=1 Tax=unclassified Kitasatospora TaxID=2633591 RepID=UPI0036C1359D